MADQPFDPMAETRSLPYSQRARVALAIARAIAAGRGDAEVTSAHVALGLLREGENAAIAVLHHAGVPLGELRAELEVALGPPAGGTRPDEVALPLTPGEQRTVEQALAASGKRGDEHLGPQHLLLAVLADTAGPMARLLARHGIDAETAAAHVAAVVRPCGHAHRSPPSPPAV